MTKNNQKQRPKRGGMSTGINDAKSVIARRVGGYAVTPPREPPAIDNMTWSAITVDITAPAVGLASITNFAYADLYTQFASQTALSNAQLRVKGWHAWLISPSPTAGAGLGLVMSPWSDYEGGTQNYLCTLHDLPGVMDWPRLGYVYPEKQQVFPGDSADTAVKLVSWSTDQSLVAGTIYIQFFCEWRTYSGGP
jgi:hypothetical protein